MKVNSAGYVSDAEDGPGIVAANAWTRRSEAELPVRSTLPSLSQTDASRPRICD